MSGYVGQTNMALINCEECGKEISDKANHCVNCGAPVAPQENVSVDRKPDNQKENSTINEKFILEGIIAEINSVGASIGEIIVDASNGKRFSTGPRSFRSLKFYQWSVGDFVSFENDNGVIKNLVKSSDYASVAKQSPKVSNQEQKQVQPATLSLEEQNLNNALFAGLVALIVLGVYLFSINNGSDYAEARVYSAYYNIRQNGVSCLNLGIFSFCHVNIFEPDGSSDMGVSIVIGESVHSGRFTFIITALISVVYIWAIYATSKRLFLNTEQKSRFAIFEEKFDKITDNLTWIMFWAVIGFGILSIVYLSA